MKKTKLTQLLSGFSNPEIKRFNSFLKSPYHNNKIQFVKIYEYLVKFHPAYENEKLTEEEAFKKAYPQKQFSYVLFKNLLSDLYDLAKKFMAIEELGRKKITLKNLFMQNLFTKSEIKSLIAKEIKITEQFYDSNFIDEAYFDNYYVFKKDASKYFSRINQYDNIDTSLNEEVESFISMGLNNLLIYALFFETYNSTHKNTGYIEIIDKLIELFNSADKIKKPVNALFYKVLQLMKTDDEKLYFEIIEMLKEQEKFLGIDPKLWVYQPLEAFLIKRVKNGEKKFYRPQFELYKHCFESGLYDNEVHFAEGKLLMTVETAIRIHEFEWIETTINKYVNKLSVDNRDDYYNFSMAKIVQAKGENEKALVMLNKINLDTGPLKSMARNILFKIYYELGYYENARSAIDAYRHYLARDKELSETYKDSVLNFFKLYNKLFEIKINNNNNTLADLEYETDRSNNVIFKQWLLEKIDELKK